MRYVKFYLALGLLVLMASCSNQPGEDSLSTTPSKSIISFDYPVSDSIYDPANLPPATIIQRAVTYIYFTVYDSTIGIEGDSTSIYATTFFGNGNHVGEGYPIRFEIINFYPNNASFQYPPSNDSVLLIFETITDSAGRASVKLFSGTRRCTVRIKAVYIENEDVFIEQDLINIVSGPAAHVGIFAYNIGQHQGNYNYYTEIIGMVWDQYTNPCMAGIPGWFEVIPDSIAYINPDTVYTNSHGVIQTRMRYLACHIFDTVRVIGHAGSIVDTSDYIVLPLYYGDINTWSELDTIVLFTPYSADTSEINTQLLDGSRYPVSNGVIIFTVQNCGEIAGQMVDTTDQNGLASTLFSISYDQIPHLPPNPPECTASVGALLRGYPDVEGWVNIYCSRPE